MTTTNYDFENNEPPSGFMIAAIGLLIIFAVAAVVRIVEICTGVKLIEF